MKSRNAAFAWSIGLAAAFGGAQPVPKAVEALAAKAHLAGAVTAWCGGELRPGHHHAFAVAVRAPGDGGRYVVLDADGTATELAAYNAGADLSCYSVARAKQLDATIKRSETLRGRISPRWNTTVVCGFIDNTTASCWQYSPADRTFVKIGGWTT